MRKQSLPKVKARICQVIILPIQTLFKNKHSVRLLLKLLSKRKALLQYQKKQKKIANSVKNTENLFQKREQPIIQFTNL